MTEYRVLTRSGCLAGSQIYTASGTFTAPSGVYQVKTSVTYISGDIKINYYSVTPGQTYSVVKSGNMFTWYWNFGGHGDISGKGTFTVEWSNEINNHA